MRRTDWSPVDRYLTRPLPFATAFFFVFTVCHFISLPTLVTWDGHEYIDLADVLGSERFPKDWLIIRTPLFPLMLKLGFAIFGRNPMAAQLVPLAMAVLGSLLMASSVRRVAGEWTAAVSLVVLALYPTLVVFEHVILTETGTFFFLSLALRLCLWMPETPGAAWKKAASLGLALGAGYYWRPTVLMLAPWFALLHVLSARELFRTTRQGKLQAGLQALLLVMVLPWSLARPWSAQFNREEVKFLNRVVIRSFVIRQALLPPDDARMARVRDEYQAAIQTASRQGFLSGIAWVDVSRMGGGITPPLPSESALHWYTSIIREYPARYAAGVGRTLLFYLGLDAAENEVKGYRNMVLSPVVRNSLIGSGPPRVMERVKTELAQSTGPGLLKRVLGLLGRIFDWLLIVCNLATMGLLAASLVRRDYALLAFSGTPVLFALGHAAALMSINRLMVPIYPMTLACGAVALFRVGGFWRRRGSADKPAHDQARRPESHARDA